MDCQRPTLEFTSCNCTCMYLYLIQTPVTGNEEKQVLLERESSGLLETPTFEWEPSLLQNACFCPQTIKAD